MKRRKTSLVAKAVAKKAMAAHLADLAIKAHLTADGQRDRDLLSQFAFILGLGAQVSINLGNDEARTKRLHAALRDVLGMSVSGGCWKSAKTSRLYELAQEATALAIDNVDIGMDAHPSASCLAARIQSGVATMADVAGAEIYREAA